MLKVVLDTNQIVSSIIVRHGLSAKIFDAWRQRQYLLMISREIIQETKKVLFYPRIMEKYRLTQESVNAALDLLEHEAIVHPITVKIDIIQDDPEDNKILACAVTGQADYLVSGEEHLLSLKKYKNIAIIKAREFLEVLNVQ